MIESVDTLGQGGPLDRAHTNVPSDDGLFDIMGLLFRRKRLILLGLIVGLELAGVYYLQATPIYESYAEILVMPKNSELPTTSDSFANGQQQLVDEGIMSTHVMLLKSRQVVEGAIQKRRLTELPSIKKALETDSEDDPPKDPFNVIANNLTISAGGDGSVRDARVLRAKYEGPEKKDNVAIVNAIVESYQAFLGDTFSDTNQEAVTLIAQAKDSLGKELDQLETDYRKFREDAPLIWKGEESLNIHKARLEKVEERLTEVIQESAETKSRLDMIQETLSKKNVDELSDVEKLALLGRSDTQRLNELVSATRGNPFFGAYEATRPINTEKANTEYQRLLSLLLEEAKLLEDYGSGSHKVRSVRTQIHLTRDYLAKNTDLDLPDTKGQGLTPGELLETHVGLLKHDLDDLERLRAELEKVSQTAKKEAKLLVVFELQGETMRGEIERKKVLYEAVIDRLREMNLIKNYGGYITKVIAPAVEPTRKASPKLVLVVGLGGVVGLFLGCGLAFTADVVDKTFRNPDEVRASMNLPILAHVATMSRRRVKTKSPKGNGKPILDPSLITYHQPHSLSAENFREIRTAINVNRDGSPDRIIQVTSPNPKDGKTTIAANLAVVSANADKQVLLIDCDLRRPRLDRVFGCEAKMGLSNVLAGEAELPDAMLATAIPGLMLLPCGPVPANPSELLSRRLFAQMLERVRDEYDLVIIDSPPLLNVTDAAVIAQQVDGVILTVRITKNGGPSTVYAKQLLDDVGANVIGSVVNVVEENRQYQRAYYGQKYGSGCGGKYGDDS